VTTTSWPSWGNPFSILSSSPQTFFFTLTYNEFRWEGKDVKVERNEKHLPFEETWLSDGRVDMVEVTRNLGPKT
jgi:hypothetical protein